jgi:hypothetical protein
MASKKGWHETHRIHVPEMALPASVARQFKAQAAIEFLIGQNEFWPGTKNDFAAAMEWLTRDGKPDRHLVEEVCSLTRDQESLGLTEFFGGFVISYAPSRGGMVLWTDEEAPLDHYVHMFAGDMQRERQHRTENRRRLPYWHKAGDVASNMGDTEVARLCYQAENEINSTGFVSEHIGAQLMRVLASRGFLS